MMFLNVNGREERGDGSPSYFNIDEISLVSQLVGSLINDQALIDAGLPVKLADIGVISPYSGQVKKIRKKLNQTVRRPCLSISRSALRVHESYLIFKQHKV